MGLMDVGIFANGLISHLIPEKPSFRPGEKLGNHLSKVQKMMEEAEEMVHACQNWVTDINEAE